jgi:uncharacterized protein YjbI with pentapeptide repeats
MGKLHAWRGIAVALGASIVLTAAPGVATAAPAVGAKVIDGCTIVPNPSATNFTNCPGADLNHADLSSLNLAYADLAGAHLNSASVSHTNFDNADLAGAGLSKAESYDNVTYFDSANLKKADLAGAGLADTQFVKADLQRAWLVGARIINGDFIQAHLHGANLTNTGLNGSGLQRSDLTYTNLTDANLDDVQLQGADLKGATLTGANVTATVLVPSQMSVQATGPSGAVVTWPIPAGLLGATPGSCSPPSGSTFPDGTTTVTCQVIDSYGNVATGTFLVTVTGGS